MNERMIEASIPKEEEKSIPFLFKKKNRRTDTHGG
jgi:hypothetical protein